LKKFKASFFNLESHEVLGENSQFYENIADSWK